MRAFRYRFEKLLAYRRHQEKQRQRDLAAALKLEQTQEQKIDAILHDQQTTQSRRRNCLTGSVEPGRLSGYYRYFIRLQQLERANREVLQHLTGEVDRKRTALVEAARTKKIYEKLKERHREKYEREFSLYAQKENDEIGQKTFFRNR